ncbi:MAG: hypothetical protein D9V44_07010 [Actinobacteria bacterium]|nr:MAG: hypothetical protein D9V44_07010 [Actinomycetota bacterium]
MSDQLDTSAPTYPPVAEQPPVQVAPTPAPQPATTKRKGRGCLIAILIVLALVALLVVGGMLFVKNAAKPKDLGVTYTEADYWSAMAKAGVVVNEVPEGETWGTTDVVYSGSKPIDATFTPAEVSALFAFSHQGGWPVSDAQVRFTGGDSVELSASIDYAGTSYPVYAKASAAMSGATISGSLQEAEVLGVTVPATYFGAGESYALGFINSRLARVTGLNITTAEVTPEGLHLVGTVPATAERVPR